uniref:Integrase_SAM-like_N domain-containing protein n=1 Tax=Parastrongyloides trichosuri TaxID=131310 RepID=A0A0N4Z5H5_PARTI
MKNEKKKAYDEANDLLHRNYNPPEAPSQIDQTNKKIRVFAYERKDAGNKKQLTPQQLTSLFEKYVRKNFLTVKEYGDILEKIAVTRKFRKDDEYFA